MPVNNTNAGPRAYRPRPRVLVGGVPLPGCMAVSVTSTNDFHGDTFSAQFATSAAVSGFGDQAWWSSQETISVDVQVGQIPPGGGEANAVWTSMLTGIVDQVESNLLSQSVSINGRDQTSLLNDTGEGGFDVNQTSSEVVTALAKQVGLTPDVYPTTTIIGRLYELEQGQGRLQRGHRVATMWDAVVELARLEGFDAWVSGSTLHFQPRANANSEPYVVNVSGIVRTSGGLSVKAKRALHIAGGVKVTVRSWNARLAQAITSTASTVGAKGSQKQYNVLRAGMTQAQADAKAQQVLKEILHHERTLDFDMPGDLTPSPRMMLRLEGTNTEWDQAYYIQTVTHTVDSSGFQTSVTVKNQSPDVQTGSS